MKFKLKKKYIIIAILLLAAAVIGWQYMNKKPVVEYVTAKVERGKLIQTVSDTGTVKSAEEIDLNFVGSGKLAKIDARIGQKVTAGQVLAQLDTITLLLNQRQAGAALSLAQSNLQKLLNGASDSDLAVAKATVRQAEVAYQNTKLNYDRVKQTTETSIAQAQKTFDDLSSPTNITSNNKRDPIITTIEDKVTAAKTAQEAIQRVLDDDDAEPTLSIEDNMQLVMTKSTLDSSRYLVSSAQTALDQARASKTDANLDNAVAAALALLNETYKSLSYCYAALQHTIVSQDLTQANLDALKTNISSQMTSVTAGITGVQTANQTLKDAINTAVNALDTAKSSAGQQLAAAQAQIDSAESGLELAKSQLAKLQAPARSEDISAARAQVAQAQASYESVSSQLANNQIKAPIDGVITKSNYEVGETTSMSKAVFSMLSKSSYEIDLDISETDINKVNVGDKAEVTFDAFGEDNKFAGEITFIEPAQTVIQDVVYYKTNVDKLVFPGATSEKPTGDWQVKPGMTANVIITAAEKDNVLYIPQRAVIEKENQNKIVRVLVDGAPVEKPVTLGLNADDGLVEVTSGVEEGEEIITSVKNGTAK